jgi:hypothetical protein
MRTSAEGKVLIPLSLWSNELLGYIELEEYSKLETTVETSESYGKMTQNVEGQEFNFHEANAEFKGIFLDCLRKN